MNPAGIIFGVGASLNVPADFTATTATSIGFGSNWFNASGANNYENLVGTPSAFAFSYGGASGNTTSQAGSIVNSGQLSLASGKNLTLLGGTVISTSTSGGQITVAAVPGENVVRINQPGHLLSLEVQPLPTAGSPPEFWTLPILSLPQLLTGGNTGNATGLIVNPDGTVQLISSGIEMPTDSVVVGNVSTAGGGINLYSRGNITTSTLNSSPSLSRTNGGDIILNATGSITTGEIYSGGTSTVSGNITLISVGDIVTQAISSSNPFTSANSGGKISVTSTAGAIRTDTLNSSGSPFFGYTRGGDITLDANTAITTGDINSSSPAEILGGRGGHVTLFANGAISTGDINSSSAYWYGGNINLTSRFGAVTSGDFNSSGNTIGLGNTPRDGYITIIADNKITAGSISSSPGGIGNGAVILTSQNDIETASILSNFISLYARNDIATGELIGSDITLTSTAGSISTANLDSSNPFISSSAITLTAANRITTGDIKSFGYDDGGVVTFAAKGDIEVGSINAQSASAIGGHVDIRTNGFLRIFSSFTDLNGVEFSISTAGINGNGSITIQHGGNGVTPFIVGNSATQGTEKAITAGNTAPEQTIFSIQSFLDSYTQDSIQIITSSPLDVNPSPIPSLPIPIQEPSSPTNPGGSSNNSGSGSSSPINPGGSSNNSGSGSASRSIPDFPFNISDFSLPNPPVPLLPPIPTTSVLVDRATIADNLNQGKLEEGILQIEELRKKEFEDYFGKRFPAQLMSVSNIRDRLRTVASQTQLKPAVIYAVALPTYLALVLVQPEGEIVYKRVSEANSEALNPKFLNLLRSDMSDPLNTIYKVQAKQLYDWLIRPLEADLQAQGIDTLLFSLDPGLQSIPLAALFDGQQFLVEKYRYSLVPSLTLSNAQYVGVGNAQLMAMGISEFPPGFIPLPAVPMEISTITQKLWLGKSFLNQEVTMNNLKVQRQQPFQIIHLATHAKFQSEGGQRDSSYIQLWDKKLLLAQLTDLKWSDPPMVELLVLSACETALGDKLAEMGFAGLAVQAGVKSAIASLWDSDDVASLGLMTEFYQRLRESPLPIKAEALRQAQIAMLRGKVRIENGQLIGTGLGKGVSLPLELGKLQDTSLSHPSYWAAFTVIGSPW